MDDNYFDFKEICKEIRAEQNYKKRYNNLTEGEKYYLDEDIKNNYKNMKKNLKEVMVALGLDINKYVRENGDILIPANEKEFCKRAYMNRTSPAAKKLRGKKKTELTFSDIENEITSLSEVIDKENDSEDAEMLKGQIKYTQNYEVLKKIDEVKEPLYKLMLDSMDSILKDNFPLNGSEATYLIDFYFDSIRRSTEVWKRIVRKYTEIRDEEIESRINFNEDIGDYEIRTGVEYTPPIPILRKAIDEYYKELEEAKPRDRFSLEQLNQLKEALDSIKKEVDFKRGAK